MIQKWECVEESCSVDSSGKAIDCIVITWAGCSPTHQTIQPTTSPWKSPNQTHHTSTSYSGTSNLINLFKHTDNNASQYVDNSKFWLEAGLPIWRRQSVSGWLSCLLGKDSRLYSYLKKRLHNPTTIQSTTSAPRTASTLLLHQRSSKVIFLQWYIEKKTGGVIFIILCKIHAR